jgi:hypothetical protein
MLLFCLASFWAEILWNISDDDSSFGFLVTLFAAIAIASAICFWEDDLDESSDSNLTRVFIWLTENGKRDGSIQIVVDLNSLKLMNKKRRVKEDNAGRSGASTRTWGNTGRDDAGSFSVNEKCPEFRKIVLNCTNGPIWVRENWGSLSTNERLESLGGFRTDFRP